MATFIAWCTGEEMSANEIVVELREMARDNCQPDCDLDTLRNAARKIEHLSKMLDSYAALAASK